MNNVKVCYTNRKNIGDSINPYIFEKILHVDFENVGYRNCDITGIGSGLRRFFVPRNSLRNLLTIIIGRTNRRSLVLWSAGFLQTPTGREISTRKNIVVASVRGELSKKWVEKILNRKLDCTTGDAGLLAADLITSPKIKKYDVGIIPHDKDRTDVIVGELQKNLSSSIVIDVQGDVMDVLEQIASCRTVVSSSLHGLIFADSFHIPNLHIIISDRLSGDGFKFKDYYSCYGMSDVAIDIRDEERLKSIRPEKIISEYKVSPAAVEKKKSEIKEAFWKHLKRIDCDGSKQ